MIMSPSWLLAAGLLLGHLLAPIDANAYRFPEPAADHDPLDTDGAFLLFPESSFTRAKLRPFDAITVEAWVKLQSWDESASIVAKPYSILYSKETRSRNQSPYSLFKLGRSGGSDQLLFSVVILAKYSNGKERTEAVSVSSKSALVAGEWVHVAGTYNSTTGDAAVYIGGVLDNKVTTRVPGPLDARPRIPLYVGRPSRTAPGQQFHGLVDEVRIWNVSRTQEQIGDCHQEHMYGDEPNLLFYMHLEAGAEVESTGNCHLFRSQVEFHGATVEKEENAPVMRHWELPAQHARSHHLHQHEL